MMEAVVEKRAPRRSSTPMVRIEGQPAFVLHSYPYKETSLIIEAFSRDHGRIALVAKGAKKPHSALRSVLQTLQPLSISWTGRSEIRTLIAAEWVGGLPPVEKSALLCGFYMNELLMKLLARDDAHPELFDHYVATLNQLAHQQPAPIVLRQFERALLKQIGVAGDLSCCLITREPVVADTYYIIEPERGVRPAQTYEQGLKILGKTLQDMERNDYTDLQTQSQSKNLMRFLLAYQLQGAVLNTRQILMDLMQL